MNFIFYFCIFPLKCYCQWILTQTRMLLLYSQHTDRNILIDNLIYHTFSVTTACSVIGDMLNSYSLSVNVICILCGFFVIHHTWPINICLTSHGLQILTTRTTIRSERGIPWCTTCLAGLLYRLISFKEIVLFIFPQIDTYWFTAKLDTCQIILKQIRDINWRYSRTDSKNPGWRFGFKF